MNIEDIPRLITYLRSNGYLGVQETPLVKVLAGGVSNRTVLVERDSGQSIVVKQALEKLRVKEDWFSDPARIYREAEGMRLLSSLAPAGAITPLVFEDKDHQLLGMEAVPQPHVNWKQALLNGDIDKDVVTQFGHCLGQIHEKFQPEDYPEEGIISGLDFFESLRLEPYYLFSAERVPAAASFLHQLVDETRRLKLTLVHGDYSPKNVLLREGRMVLLDHEVIHIGDPAFDLGFSMTHLLSKAHHLPQYRKAFIEAAHLYWSTYAQIIQEVRWFAGFEQRAVKHTLACLLARVAGRSPLEYLSREEKARQQDTAVKMMKDPPKTITQMIDAFSTMVNQG